MAVATLDVQTMETAALKQAKLEAARKANEIFGADGHVPTPEDQERGKAYLQDCQILETEMQRRREIDGSRESLKSMADLFGAPATMPEAGNVTVSNTHQTPGLAFTKSDIYLKLKADGTFNHEPNTGNIPGFGITLSPRETWARQRKAFGEKTLIYSSTGGGGAAFVIPEYETDVERLARPGPDILDLLRVVPTTADTIYWMRQDTRSTVATAVSQATALTGNVGLKPESAMAWSRQTTAVETIAVWVAATNQQLADAPELRSLIDDELTFDLFLQLDWQILQGTGTAPDLRGILNTSGIQTVGFSTAVGNVADNILHGIVAIATANEPEPNGVIMNPLDWEPLRTLKTAGSGEYIMGPPTIAGPMTLWGYPLVLSNRMLENTGLVGNFLVGAKLHMREDSTVKVGMAGDDFLYNRVRILAELRAALTVRRPACFCRVTGI